MAGMLALRAFCFAISVSGAVSQVSITVTCDASLTTAQTACCNAINDVETTGGFSTVVTQAATAETIRAAVCEAGSLKTTLDAAQSACSSLPEMGDGGTTSAVFVPYQTLVATMGMCTVTTTSVPASCNLQKNCDAQSTDATCELQNDAVTWAYNKCQTCQCGTDRCFDLQSLDKSMTDANCDCQTLKAKVSDVFVAMQREMCSIARHDDDVKKADAMSQADRDTFWEQTLMGCIGPKANGFLISPVKASGVGSDASPGPCHPNVHIQDLSGGATGGNTLANCRRDDHLTVQYLFKSLVEASAAWSPSTQTAEIDLETEYADPLPANGGRTCNTDTQIEAVTVGTLASHSNIAMMVHGTMYKLTGRSMKSMSLAGLTSDVSHGTFNYWDEDKQFLSDVRHKKVAAGQSKLTVGITSFPWSSAATDESRGCFAKELSAVDTNGVKDTAAAATIALSWFDANTLTLYIPLSGATDKQQDYTDCKADPVANKAACDRSFYLKSAYSKYVMVNPTGSQETLVEAEYTFHQDSGTSTNIMYICATKANLGTHEFVFDPKTETGKGLSTTASVVELTAAPTPAPTPAPPASTPAPSEPEPEAEPEPEHSANVSNATNTTANGSSNTPAATTAGPSNVDTGVASGASSFNFDAALYLVAVVSGLATSSA